MTAAGTRPARSSGVGRWVAVVALGVLVGVMGTVLHRAAEPWGMVVCLALVLSAAVVVRAWAGLVPVAGYAVGWLAAVQVLSVAGPGGDVLVPGGDTLGYVWGLGGMVAVGVACFLPGRWFLDAPGTA
ncbi:DUF6113 family protein [Cellulomonas sp. ATA003]|uniref:DUF6113 family protein n=1 Tax=Cellulomonas sp. ATA003 TaxID=3073064 RepID=UPI002873565F|nr:DUF6113 family protein [Cellulomonas sp. ATA003]WNB85017.1 DUF6113 family protein [Cellulomonas sp. ATA003]